MRLLIADDHTLFRQSLRNLLEVHGLEVLGEATNGREAVELAIRMQPDVVLLDLSMPEMSGLEAIPRLREARPQTKIVVLTASTDDADLFEALRLGAELAHHLRPHDPLGVAGRVLDVGRVLKLAAPLEALDHERLEVRTRAVERSGVAGGAAADDDDLPDAVLAHAFLSRRRA